jgi:glycosylphosphatidylinositol deacylase
MRSRRSSRDSSTAPEDGDDSEQQQLPTGLTDECRFATAQQFRKTTDGSVKKSPPLSPDQALWSPPVTGDNGLVSQGSKTSATATVTAPTRPSESPLSKMQMEDTRNSRRARMRSNWACSIKSLAVTLLSAFVLYSIVQSYRERQCDAKGCRMSHMSPVYLKAKDFDTEHTRFASKYNLYLYREHGVDEDYPVCSVLPEPHDHIDLGANNCAKMMCWA